MLDKPLHRLRGSVHKEARKIDFDRFLDRLQLKSIVAEKELHLIAVCQLKLLTYGVCMAQR